MMTSNTTTTIDERRASRDSRKALRLRASLCKGAFVACCKGSTADRSSASNRHRRTTISTDEVYDMVTELARTQRKQTSYVSSDKTKSTSSSTKSSSNEAQHLRYQGFRSDYALGEVVRSPADMVIETSTKAAIRSVSSLQMHDFAWVRRSDGSFTYAILAYRTDDKLTFLTCDASSTKSISRKYWGTHIRRVCVEQTNCREIVSNNDTSSSEHDDVPRGFDVDQYLMELMGKKETVPLSIPFDDDSSVISDVSMPRW